MDVEGFHSAMTDELLSASTDDATAGVFRALAEVVYTSKSFDEVYDAVVQAAPRLIKNCHHASLMLSGKGHFVTAAASDDVARMIDQYEQELGEGPCLDAITNQPVYHAADFSDGSAWPRLTERVLAHTPARSLAGFRLHVDEGQTGALNLFSDIPGGIDEDAVDQGIVLASFVTVALLASHERKAASTLRDGLASNREIGKAVGLLMAFHKINDEEAFKMLRTASQDMNVKLSEVARQIVDHHNQS
jgi:hypothetical protein